jgi:mono/diheme cytochrome c family protein
MAHLDFKAPTLAPGCFRFLASLLLGLSLSDSALAGDPLKGAALATDICSECHFVLANQESPSSDVPSFVEISARQKNLSDLASILAGPHPRMPDARLSRSQMEDIAAYIHSLNKRPDSDGKP